MGEYLVYVLDFVVVFDYGVEFVFLGVVGEVDVELFEGGLLFLVLVVGLWGGYVFFFGDVFFGCFLLVEVEDGIKVEWY